mmetsp:Transcript_49596/g.124715  ORF Transcript_49596/g.124715 Transcript_49596/m.124715 type:complete len:85 (-) Transcript_49596:934-1188(-)
MLTNWISCSVCVGLGGGSSFLAATGAGSSFFAATVGPGEDSGCSGCFFLNLKPDFNDGFGIEMGGSFDTSESFVLAAADIVVTT